MTSEKIWDEVPQVTNESVELILTKYFNNTENDEIRGIKNELNVLNGDMIGVKVGAVEIQALKPNIYSHISMYEASFRLYNKRSGKNIHLVRNLVLKSYRNGNAYEESETFVPLEARVLQALSKHEVSIPTFYGYSTDTRILYMSDIQGRKFSDVFDTLDIESKEVLRCIVGHFFYGKQTPPLASEIVKEFEGDISHHLKVLEERGLIKEVERLENDIRYLPETSLILSRFDLSSRDEESSQRALTEKPDFFKYKNATVRAAIKRLLEIQKIGNAERPNIEKIVTKPSLSRYISEDISHISNILSYDTGVEEEPVITYSQDDLRKLESILTRLNHRFTYNPYEVTKDVIDEVTRAVGKQNLDSVGNIVDDLGLTEDILAEQSTQFNHGDAHPRNHMVQGEYVFLLDFGASNYSFFGNDIIDFVTYLKLFSGVEDDEELYKYFISRKKMPEYKTDNQRSLGKIYDLIVDKAYEELFGLAKIKRALRAAGNLSKTVTKSRRLNLKEPYMILEYEKRRDAYYTYLLEQLERTQLAGELGEFLTTGKS